MYESNVLRLPKVTNFKTKTAWQDRVEHHNFGQQTTQPKMCKTTECKLRWWYGRGQTHKLLITHLQAYIRLITKSHLDLSDFGKNTQQKLLGWHNIWH